MHDSAFLKLFLHYIILSIFQVDEIIGGGGGGRGQNDMFGPPPPPPNIFIGGGGRLLPQLPQDRPPLRASDLDEQGGDVYKWRIQDLQKKGGGAEKSVRVSARLIRVGAQGPAVGPLAEAQGAEPPEALEFSANKGLQDGRQE